MNQYQGLQYENILEKISHSCAFSMGREEVLALRPSFNRLKIILESQRTQEALMCTIRYSSLPFDGIRDMRDALETSLKDGLCTALDCLNVVDHERGLNSIFNYMHKLEFETPLLKELTQSLISHPEIVKKIESCISIHGDVMDSASSKLQTLRKRLKQVDAQLSSEAQKYITSNATKLMDTIITTRANRVVVLAKIAEKNTLGGLIHGESASGQTAYVEPACLLPLNNEKQSLISAEQEEVERILFECSQTIKGGAIHYQDNLQTLALLDAIFAKARFGKEEEGIIATLSDTQQMFFKTARHPFIERNKVVTNTYTMKDSTRVLLITGPNTGGKTVSLKLIGLFVLMTYSGIPICAEEATIPYFDEVYLDITDDQSIEQSLSTFSAHISKLAYITKNVTSHSLVLLDEIGSGTDPKEGESLAIAVLNDLRLKGCMTIATTHYGRLKTYGKKHKDILLASVQFDVEKMTPTFRYIEGLTGQSNALTIARRFGLKESILKEAEHLKQQQKSSEDELIEKLEAQLMETERKNDELQARLSAVRALEAELRKEKDALAMQKDNMLDKAKLEAAHYLEEIKEEAQEYFEELKSEAEAKPHKLNEFRQKIKNLQEEEEFEDENDRPFEVGNTVSLKNSMQIGKILSMTNGKYIVEVNGMKITTKEDQLRHRNAPQAKKTIKNRTINHVKPQISMECNLIGMRVDEALPVYEKYMDDVILAGLQTVRIIHGVGTGALRTAIHERLKKRKDIEYRYGGQGEGGVGATVITFVTSKNA